MRCAPSLIYFKRIHLRPAGSELALKPNVGTSKRAWYEATSQAFAVFLAVKSLEVMGDGVRMGTWWRSARRGRWTS